MHQANRNLIDRVARALDVPASRFYANIGRYGNTSSASMLIAAAEWREIAQPRPGDTVCFAAFGAGFHWGALLARQSRSNAQTSVSVRMAGGIFAIWTSRTPFGAPLRSQASPSARSGRQTFGLRRSNLQPLTTGPFG
jgi:hypothetical protein